MLINEQEKKIKEYKKELIKMRNFYYIAGSIYFIMSIIFRNDLLLIATLLMIIVVLSSIDEIKISNLKLQILELGGNLNE